MQDHMSEALKRRRGKGIALHITIGPEDEKQTDLAPSGTKEISPMGKPMAPQMDGKEVPMMEESPQMEGMEMQPDYGMDEMDQEMAGTMSDHEKGHVMNKHPKSLGERARHEALHRMKGKK